MTRVAGLAGLRVPATRPHGRLAFLLPLPLAAALGVALGLAPRPTLLVVAGVLVSTVLAIHLEWAACAVAGAAVFEDYLDLLSPWATEGLALLLLVAWLIRRARGPVGRGAPVATVVASSIFTVVLVLATAAHPNGRPGLDVVAKYGEFLLVFLLLVDSLAGSVRPLRVVRVYVYACAAASACGILTAVLGRHRVSGPLANPDDLAFFLVAALPLAWALRTEKRWRYDVLVGLLAVAALGTQSRAALAALVAMVVLALVVREVSWRTAAALVVLAGTGAALVVALVPHTVSEDRKSTRLNSSHTVLSRMPSSA